MSQFNPVIGSGKTGQQYRQDDNDGKQALLNHHKGASAPAYAEAGTIWLDDAATPWALKIFDGADWIALGKINATTNGYDIDSVGTLATTGAASFGGDVDAQGNNILSTGYIGRDADNHIDFSLDDMLKAEVYGATVLTVNSASTTWAVLIFNIAPTSGTPDLRLQNQDATPNGNTHQIRIYAQNDAAENTQYVNIRGRVEDDSDGSEAGGLEMFTMVGGSLTSQLRMNGGVRIGNPTGNELGTGKLNAQGVYDDNALLSCYVFDGALDGEIDDEKWDAKVPDRLRDDGEIEMRIHEDMRRFRARLGTAHDPLTCDGYAAHWKEKRHLTAMPNEANMSADDKLSNGQWVQRLVETVEVQAVLIEELNLRLKQLEA